MPHTDVIDEHMARRKNHDAFHPLYLPRRRKSCPNLRRLKGVRGMRSKFIAFLDNPLMKFHYRPMKRQVPYIISRQPEPPALAEAASVGHHSGRPERQRHNRISIFLRSSQLRKQPLATIHDELKILNDRRLIGENVR